MSLQHVLFPVGRRLFILVAPRLPAVLVPQPPTPQVCGCFRPVGAPPPPPQVPGDTKYYCVFLLPLIAQLCFSGAMVPVSDSEHKQHLTSVSVRSSANVAGFKHNLFCCERVT